MIRFGSVVYYDDKMDGDWDGIVLNSNHAEKLHKIANVLENKME